MKSIHVVFGAAESEATVRAHNLAVLEPDAFVHEISGTEDVRLVLASHYDRCIATLRAVNETTARSRMLEMAAATQSQLCDMTFEQASLRG